MLIFKSTYMEKIATDLISFDCFLKWDVLEGGSREELALGLFVTRSRFGGLDKMSPDWQGGFYLLVLGADNSWAACVNELRSLHHATYSHTRTNTQESDIKSCKSHSFNFRCLHAFKSDFVNMFEGDGNMLRLARFKESIYNVDESKISHKKCVQISTVPVQLLHLKGHFCISVSEE